MIKKMGMTRIIKNEILSYISWAKMTNPAMWWAQCPISKMYFGYWGSLGVSESCQTRIPEWSNPTVYWTDAVAFRCVWEHLGAQTTSLGAPTASLRAPESSGNKPECTDHKPETAAHKPGSILSYCRAVWEKHLQERCWCTWECLLLVIVQWLKLMYSVSILIYVSMYQYRYPTTHSISGLAAGAGREQVEVLLNMMIESTERYTPKWWSSEFRDTPCGRDRLNSEMHWEAVIEWTQRANWRPRSSVFGYNFGDRDGVKSGMYCEVMMKPAWICTWRPWLCVVGAALGDCDEASLEIHLHSMMERDWRSMCQSARSGGIWWEARQLLRLWSWFSKLETGVMWRVDFTIETLMEYWAVAVNL